MSIYDDLFKSFTARDENQIETSATIETFSSVEDKVRSLRQRVALEAIDSVPQIKTASVKTASKKITLFKRAQTEEAQDEQVWNDLKGYLMQLIDMRRANIDITAAFYELREKFPEHVAFIRDHKNELLDFAQKYQEKYKAPRVVPSPIKGEAFNAEEDKKTFENIADKL